jgi:hypothetical protein
MAGSNLLDIDIRPVLKNELTKTFSHDSIIREEFGCNGARVDLAVINGRLHGFEIKSDRDGLGRLATQVPIYNVLFDHMTIVVGSKHRRAVEACIPDWWGIKEATRLSSGSVNIDDVRPASDNRQVEPFALIRLLHRTEIWTILRKRKQHSDLRNASALRLQNAMHERLSPEAIAQEVRGAIKARRYFEADGRQTQSDGSCTTASSFEDSRRMYEMNLNWLLSLQFQRRPR